MRKWTAILFLLLLVNTAYIWAFAFPTVFYMTNVLRTWDAGPSCSARSCGWWREAGISSLRLAVSRCHSCWAHGSRGRETRWIIAGSFGHTSPPRWVEWRQSFRFPGDAPVDTAPDGCAFAKGCSPAWCCWSFCLPVRASTAGPFRLPPTVSATHWSPP